MDKSGKTQALPALVYYPPNTNAILNNTIKYSIYQA